MPDFDSGNDPLAFCQTGTRWRGDWASDRKPGDCVLAPELAARHRGRTRGPTDGRAASGGSLAPEPPRATGLGPESPRIVRFSNFCEIGRLTRPISHVRSQIGRVRRPISDHEETSDLDLDVSRDGRGPFSKKGRKQWPRHAVRFEIKRLQRSDLKKKPEPKIS